VKLADLGARRSLEQFRGVIVGQSEQAAPAHRLDDDLAALDVGLLDQLDPAVEAAVGDAHLGRPQPVDLAVIDDLEPERVEACRRPARPDQIAEAPELALESVGDALGDHRGKAHRGIVEEIIVVDLAEVDGERTARGDDIDRPVEVERDAHRPRKAVRGAQRKQGEHRVGADEIVDALAQRPVTAADDDHRGRLDGPANRGAHLARVLDRVGIQQLDTRSL
jgi:hypothetical protein